MKRRSRPLVAAGTGVLALALSGCTSPALLGSAAVIDGRRVPVSEVQDTVARALDLQAGSAGDTPVQRDPLAVRNEVHRRIIDAIFARAAADLGVSVTQGEVETKRESERKAAGSEEVFVQRWALGNGIPLDLVDSALRLDLLNQKMAQKLSTAAGRKLAPAELQTQLTAKLVATATAMRIRVNPRFGTFDPQAGQLVEYPYDYYRPAAAEAPEQ